MRRMNYSSLSKRVLALGIATTMAMSIAACGGSDEKENSGDGKSYTYNTYITASPRCWNPHVWEDSADRIMMDYQCEMGLVDVIANEDGSYQWTFEMAEDIKDITADFADKAKYNIADDQVGRVWQIKLNKDACWEDGTPINADTYISSMKLLLDPTMKNYRANSYYDATQADAAIYNAEAYYNNDKAGKTKYVSIYDASTEKYALGVDELDKMYIGLNDVTPFWGMSLKDAYASYGATYFTGADGTDYYKVLETIIADNDMVPVTEEIVTAIKGICSVVGSGYAEEFMEMCFYADGVYEEMKFEDVGLVKADDYTINYITVNPIEEFYFFTNMTSNWIVHEETYNAGKTEEDGIVATTYGTSAETYKSFGPYKLASFEKDKQIVLEKNEKWYGYTDGKHENQYQTTKIVVDIIAEHATQLQLFLSGQLDEITLDVDDMSTYRMSDRLYSVEQTYTFRWIFATDLDALTNLELEANDGANKKVLSYDDFRKALSLAMDRDRFCSEATPGYEPAYYLINNIYYVDIANNPNSQYRGMDEAKEAVVNLYGIKYGEGEQYATLDDAYKAVTGYDLEEAKALFQSVYEKAIADGNYTEGQPVKIRCMASASSALTEQDIAQQDSLNAMIAEATKGTGFEGKITIEFMSGAANRYEDCANGKIEMIRGAWGGAAFYPFKLIGSYTDPGYAGGYIHEQCGWDPTTDKLAIAYDFDGDGTVETLEKTYTQWTNDINDMTVYGTDTDARLAVLSALETGILSQYQCIPWGTDTVSNLLSQQLEYGFQEYNIMYAFGGVRYMTYNYDDAAWEKYVKEQGGTLSYE